MTQLKEKYPELNDIQQDLTNLKDDVTVLGRHVKQDGKEQVKEAVDELHKRLNELELKTKRQYQTLEQHVVENPGRSMAIAFFAGLAASVILGRR